MLNPTTRYIKYLELSTEAASVEEFKTKAAKKYAMAFAANAYDELEPWHVEAPFALGHLREKHIPLFGDNADKAAALLALRDKIKSIPVADKVIKETKEQVVARKIATSEGVAAIYDAFEAAKPSMIADRVEIITRSVERAKETLAQEYHWRTAKARETSNRQRAERLLSSVHAAGGVKAVATQQIDEEVMGYMCKLISKVGDITNVKVIQSHPGSFTIRGKRGDDDVMVEQKVVLKITEKGRYYNQFPARIYVNGKFTPAAEY